ncbi:translesion error-prone DNA polymerase V autoproteolytic subunit [Crenobacter sp. SG2305]|uniref:LexA family protein n=1 Tax=Crenobacter oryzisoli TaxID=3056844 RepID=UPI0025AADB64|nr:translesion error-prone DNA polymerase V autoproteolytic subunit [Crenobacter sp. SG2305]MDN0082398.1 translesion error-prone DNA polymerase V autoproteolytic subunit [Crenobacter sp. SG2305]
MPSKISPKPPRGAGRKPGTGRYGEPTRTVRVPQSQVPTIQGWLDQLASTRALSAVAQPSGSPNGVTNDVRLAGLATVHTPLPLSLNTPVVTIPAMSDKVPAGFPSPATDYVERGIDLNEHLISHPEATFIVRVSGWSMRDAGIHDGDELIVDRALTPRDGNVVVAVVDGELTVKRLRNTPTGCKLCADNPDYPDIEFRDGQEMTVWGVVTRVLHKV